MVKGVLLDIDGTLVLSNDAQAKAWVEALAKFGRPVEFAAVRKLMGMGGDILLPKLFPDLDPESVTGKELLEHRKELYLRKYAPMVKAAAGARELVVALQGRGVRTAVASSSSQVELERALEIAGVADLLTEHATGDDAERSKPAPDVVAVGLEKLRLEAPEVRLIGDSPYDIKAGAQVGVAVVAVQCGGFSDAELAGAEEIFDDPADVTRDLEHVIRGASQ